MRALLRFWRLLYAASPQAARRAPLHQNAAQPPPSPCAPEPALSRGSAPANCLLVSTLALDHRTGTGLRRAHTCGRRAITAAARRTTAAALASLLPVPATQRPLGESIGDASGANSSSEVLARWSGLTWGPLEASARLLAGVGPLCIPNLDFGMRTHRRARKERRAMNEVNRGVPIGRYIAERRALCR